MSAVGGKRTWKSKSPPPPAFSERDSHVPDLDASYKFDPKWSVFGKYEYVEPTQDTAPSMNESYFNAGISFSPAKIVDFALVYKHDEAENGSISTSNGTIGGAIDGSYDEVGLFGQFRW